MRASIVSSISSAFWVDEGINSPSGGVEVEDAEGVVNQACETGGEVEGVFNPPPMTGAMGEEGRDWIEDMAMSSLAVNADSVLATGGRCCDALVVANGILSIPGNLQVVCETQGGVEGALDPPSMTGAVGEDGRDVIKNMATSSLASLAADADGA